MKSAGQLWRISVTTTTEAEDAVGELLGPLLKHPASSCFNVKTGLSTVSTFCEQRPNTEARKNISAGLRQIKSCGLKIGSGKMAIGKVHREDWAESWKRHFKPFEIKLKNRRGELREPSDLAQKTGRRGSGTRITRPSEGKSLLIKPSWSKRKPRRNQAVVVLDPGLSFGTGRHPTTAFCLGEIVKRRDTAKSQSFLDLGTGSGILAIAAVKLGYQPVRAIDFDPEAIRVARANARVNRVHNKLRIARGDVAKLPFHARRQYDLVCANLISNLLMAERRRIVAQLKRYGTLVLAGILKTEFAQVQRAFEKPGLKLISRKCQGEWCSGSFCFIREKSF
jgi:ribosomal protein L11 methyltransferase